MQLVNVRGPRYFHQFKIVDGVTNATLHAACHPLNLLQIVLISTKAMEKQKNIVHL